MMMNRETRGVGGWVGGGTAAVRARAETRLEKRNGEALLQSRHALLRKRGRWAVGPFPCLPLSPGVA